MCNWWPFQNLIQMHAYEISFLLHPSFYCPLFRFGFSNPFTMLSICFSLHIHCSSVETLQLSLVSNKAHWVCVQREWHYQHSYQMWNRPLVRIQKLLTMLEMVFREKWCMICVMGDKSLINKVVVNVFYNITQLYVTVISHFLEKWWMELTSPQIVIKNH